MVEANEFFESGSSPRMRGAPFSAYGRHTVLRIIPADAGSTTGDDAVKVLDEDHPRGCGEHNTWYWIWFSTLGSSPRMRGAPVDQGAYAQVRRIIPADAGSTWAGHTCIDAGQDHPRGCGEHWAMIVHSSRSVGSSPRMRGALRCWLLGCVAMRIIPADAGSTS